MSKSLVIGITGASGTLGQMLTKKFNELGISTVALQRSLTDNSWLESINSLNARSETIKLVIHAANPKAPRSKDVIDQFIENTDALIKKCNEFKFEFLFISTLSIHNWNYSDYAKYKFAIEQKVITTGGSAIRLGLLESNETGSTYKRLFELIEKSIVLRIALQFSKSVFYKTNLEAIEDFAQKLAINPVLKNKINFITSGNPFLIKSSKVDQKYSRVEISDQLAQSAPPVIFKIGLKFLSIFHFGPADSLVNLCAGQKLPN